MKKKLIATISRLMVLALIFGALTCVPAFATDEVSASDEVAAEVVSVVDVDSDAEPVDSTAVDAAEPIETATEPEDSTENAETAVVVGPDEEVAVDEDEVLTTAVEDTDSTEEGSAVESNEEIEYPSNKGISATTYMLISGVVLLVFIGFYLILNAKSKKKSK